MTNYLGTLETSALGRLADEELVILARNGLRLAEHTLVLRYLERIGRQVNHLTRKWHLNSEDTADARQEAAAFWFPTAIRAYDLSRYRGPTGCRFVTLQDHVIALRFQNFARALRRRASHYTDALALPDVSGHGAMNLNMQTARGQADPGRVAIRREEEERLTRAVAVLPEADRAMWAWVACGHSLRGWARERGNDHKQIVRRWCQLFILVRRQVKG